MLKKFLIGIALLIGSAATFATTIDVKDGETKPARISLKDPTRLKVDGDQITDVFGRDVKSAENQAGALMLTADKGKGEIYIQPAEGTPIGKASSLFIVTNNATYTLLVVTTDTPGDTLVLRDMSKRNTASYGNMPYRSPTHLREIKKLLKGMAARETPSDLKVVTTGNIVVPLWQEVRFVLEKRFDTGDRWTGDEYLLTNISANRMVLDEREFYNDASIATIAIEKPELQPGQSTEVFIVRDSAQ